MELTTANYKQTEVGLIPEDWEVRTLGDIGDVKMCKRIFSYQTSKRGDVPFFKIGTFGKEPDAFISWELYQEFRKKYSFPKEGYLLISASGTIGRTVEYKGEDAYYQDSNIIWIDNDEKLITNKYLNYTLKVVKYKTEGSTIKRLYNSIIKRSEFAIPPTIDEQKAIATALSDVDDLIANMGKLISKKKAIKQGAMQQLLTPPHKGGKRLAGYTGEWVEKKLGDIAQMNSGGTPSSKVSEYYNGNINWVSITDMTNTGKYILSSGKKITEKGLQNSSARLFPIDTVLLAMYASIGKCTIAKAEVTTSQAILGITVNNSLDIEYLYYYLIYKKDELISQGQQGTQSNLNKGMVQNIIMCLPQIREQNAIAQILSDMDSEIEKLETKKTKYQDIKQGMMQELLTGKTRLV